MARPIVPNQPVPADLWRMQPHAFNAWRAENDLPVLFDFLAGLLPGFNEWEESSGLSRETMLRVVPTGDRFKGDSMKTAVKREDDLPGT